MYTYIPKCPPSCVSLPPSLSHPWWSLFVALPQPSSEMYLNLLWDLPFLLVAAWFPSSPNSLLRTSVCPSDGYQSSLQLPVCLVKQRAALHRVLKQSWAKRQIIFNFRSLGSLEYQGGHINFKIFSLFLSLFWLATPTPPLECDPEAKTLVNYL